MRNKYKDKCYVCGKTVNEYEGFFERSLGRWKVKHATGTVEELKRCKKSKAYKDWYELQKSKTENCG